MNLFVEGTCTRAPPALVYAAAMAACLAAAVALAVRQRASPWQTFGLVLLGDLVYVIVVSAIEHPVRTLPR